MGFNEDGWACNIFTKGFIGCWVSGGLIYWKPVLWNILTFGDFNEDAVEVFQAFEKAEFLIFQVV